MSTISVLFEFPLSIPLGEKNQRAGNLHQSSAMDLVDILTPIIATGALLVALASFAYTIRSNRANRRMDDLQQVRAVATTNVARFNGIFTGLQHKPEPTPKDLMEPVRLYSEVRDVYKSFKHSFPERDRIRLDALLDDIESSYDSDDLASSLASAIPKMPAFLNELEAKLNR